MSKMLPAVCAVRIVLAGPAYSIPPLLSGADKGHWDILG
jgi:hypothetical protein